MEGGGRKTLGGRREAFIDYINLSIYRQLTAYVEHINVEAKKILAFLFYEKLCTIKTD